jgi:hypothetical protein
MRSFVNVDGKAQELKLHMQLFNVGLGHGPIANGHFQERCAVCYGIWSSSKKKNT